MFLFALNESGKFRVRTLPHRGSPVKKAWGIPLVTAKTALMKAS
jgi:hypothetical protein